MTSQQYHQYHHQQQQQSDDRARAVGLRRVAVASVAALAVVLPLAVATDGPRHGEAHRESVRHSVTHDRQPAEDSD